jgi:prophage antirepressor-like protein
MEPKNAVVLFEETPIHKEWIDGQQWIPAIDVAKALGYDNPSRAVSDMMKGNEELFADYEKIVSRSDGKQRRKIRVFNQKGVIAFCIKSNKASAIPFQRWAVTQLEKVIQNIPSDIRLISKQKRVKFTDTLKEHGCTKPGHYINITKDMKEGLGIDKKKPKDSCDLIEVMKIAASEDVARINLIQNNADGYKECHDESVKASLAVEDATRKSAKTFIEVLI